MKKSWGMLAKILNGEKTIESRWSQHKSAPWGRIKAGEAVYFKNSGEPVTVRSRVSKVLSWQGLTPRKVKEILGKYGREDGIEPRYFEKFYQLFKGKKYCQLIFLQNPKGVKPFNIDKKGFGSMASWLCVGWIDRVKV